MIWEGPAGASLWALSTAARSRRTAVLRCSRVRTGGSDWPSGWQPASPITAFRRPSGIRSPDLLRQRIFGIALGYEDLIDHDALRFDPALAAVIDKPGGVLAGKSTLNRLEHAGKIGSDRHHKLDHDADAIERLFVDLFLDAHTEPPVRIVIDLDATDDPLLRRAEGRHFHGYYDCYCYLPLYIFCGRHLLAAKLRSSANDAADGACDEVARIVGHIREHWPRTTIVIRADSGFCRDDLMTWCEDHGVQYVLGLAGNERLTARIEPEIKTAERKARRTGHPARVFTEFAYRTRKSWAYERRVIAKAEWTQGAANPRFIVTNVHPRSVHRSFSMRRSTAHAARWRTAEGMSGRPVRRPHADADDAVEPAPALVVVAGLRADVCGAPHRARRDQARSGDLRHDPAELLRARSPRHDLGSARQARLRVQLSGRAGVRHGSPTIVRLSGGDRFTARGSTKEDQRQSDRLPDRRQ